MNKLDKNNKIPSNSLKKYINYNQNYKMYKIKKINKFPSLLMIYPLNMII
jgi:hypothetical protein